MVAVAQLKLFKSLASFLSNQKSETLTVQSGIWVSGRRIVGDQGFNWEKEKQDRGFEQRTTPDIKKER